jgi:hypothetical protein
MKKNKIVGYSMLGTVAIVLFTGLTYSSYMCAGYIGLIVEVIFILLLILTIIGTYLTSKD